MTKMVKIIFASNYKVIITYLQSRRCCYKYIEYSVH